MTDFRGGKIIGRTPDPYDPYDPINVGKQKPVEVKRCSLSILLIVLIASLILGDE